MERHIPVFVYRSKSITKLFILTIKYICNFKVYSIETGKLPITLTIVFILFSILLSSFRMEYTHTKVSYRYCSIFTFFQL
nr:MAG TPA: hypothetical protein [Caudoviricetes sp.]